MAARTLLGCRSQRQWRLNPLSTTFQLLWPWMSRSPSLSLRFLTHSFIHSFSAPSTSGVAPPLGISVSTHAGKCTQVRCAGDRCLSAQREVERGVRHSGAGPRLGRREGPAPGDRGGAGERGRRDQPGGAARCSRMLPEPVQRAPREPWRERCCFIVVYLAICWELKRRVKKSWEEAALEARARGRPTATQRRAPGISRHSALPPSLASKTRMGFTGHQPRKASLLGIASPAFQAWGPHGEPCVLRPPSSRLGPAARASACPSRPQLLPGRGGVRGGGSSRPQDSCPPRRNPSHRQTPCRLCREGGDTEGTHACL